MENNQVPQHPPATVDRMKASLGLATLLQSFLLPRAQQQQQAQQEPAEEQEKPKEDPKEEKKEPEMAKVELDLTAKLDEVRKELKEDFQRELDGIKEQITSALAEDDNEPTETK